MKNGMQEIPEKHWPIMSDKRFWRSRMASLPRTSWRKSSTPCLRHSSPNSYRPAAAARAEGRIGGRRRKLDAAKRKEIAESVLSGRKSGAEMARLYDVSQATASRIVAEYRIAGLKSHARLRRSG